MSGWDDNTTESTYSTYDDWLPRTVICGRSMGFWMPTFVNASCKRLIKVIKLTSIWCIC